MTKFVVTHPEVGESDPISSRKEAEERAEQFAGASVEVYQADTDSTQAEVVEEPTEDTNPVEEANTTEAKPVEQSFDETEGYDLPDKPPVDEDPMVWMPGDFTDTIEGKDVINRKGYEVMAHYYNIGTDSICEVGPEETNFEYARVKATATTEEGVEYGAQGSAHVERGDDKELLLEMADTRARKRALAQATGTGMLAVEELKNEL